MTSTSIPPKTGKPGVTLSLVTPALAVAIRDAMNAISRCTDFARHAGCRRARCYLDGAAGNLRRALVELIHRHPTVAAGEPNCFDVAAMGGSEVVSSSGYSDTIHRCATDSGPATVRALVPALNPRDGVWMWATGELGDVHVRGRVIESRSGYRFEEAPGIDNLLPVRPPVDLARDLVASGLDLSSKPVLAIALEVALATGSWVHLGSGSRWYADLSTARSVVRLLRGTPGADPALVARLGVCIDRQALLLIEPLGWRHWPTPGID